MAEKLNTGAVFPRMSLNLVDGSSIDLPEGLGGRYKAILFYRGHW